MSFQKTNPLGLGIMSLRFRDVGFRVYRGLACRVLRNTRLALSPETHVHVCTAAFSSPSCRYLRCAFGLKAVISRHSPNQNNIHKPLNPSFCVELGALHCKVHVLPGMWFGVYIWGQNIIGHPKSLV